MYHKDFKFYKEIQIKGLELFDLFIEDTLFFSIFFYLNLDVLIFVYVGVMLI